MLLLDYFSSSCLYGSTSVYPWYCLYLKLISAVMAPHTTAVRYYRINSFKLSVPYRCCLLCLSHFCVCFVSVCFVFNWLSYCHTHGVGSLLSFCFHDYPDKPSLPYHDLDIDCNITLTLTLQATCLYLKPW